jgi:hypothetical protein
MHEDDTDCDVSMDTWHTEQAENSYMSNQTAGITILGLIADSE